MPKMPAYHAIDSPEGTGMIHCYANEDETYFFGVYEVIFGYRVRAGELGSPYLHLDWCCGNNWPFVEAMHCVMKCVLENDVDLTNVPTVSKLKPAFNDLEFMTLLLSLVSSYKLDVKVL